MKNCVSKTLPIKESDGGWIIDSKVAREFGEKISENYCFSEPYPHIVIDNFLPEKLIEKIEKNFPKIETDNEINFNEGFTLNKRQVNPNSCVGFSKSIFYLLNSNSIIEFLEGLTCINGLLPDPHYEGAGFHEIKKGGYLGVHADFRINERLNLHRRLNMLIYLNKDWNTNWGGNLELWDRNMTSKQHSISPIYNRCVIFNTDADSFHGHPDPLECPTNITRKSIALYYYTASHKIYEEIPSTGTNWKSRPNDKNNFKILEKKLARQEWLKDYLPPVLNRLRSKIKK